MVQAQELRVGRADIEEAARRIKGVAWRTPLVPAGRHEDGHVHLKLECLQRTGSFKIRGAWNRMSRATPAERKRGFVTISAGNHGQAVAWCARKLEAPCTVWVPETAVERKVRAIEALGARIVRKPHEVIMESMRGDRMDGEAQVYVPPFGDRFVIAGQGTIGLEILEDLPSVGSVVVPIGGGGLATGVATALQAQTPKIQVYGVQAANAAPVPLSFRSGRAERVEPRPTIADGIGATFSYDYMLPALRELLEDCFTVGEDELRSAIQHLASEAHVVAEAAGASSLAAARAHAGELKPPVVCVVSGGNIDPALLADLVGPRAP